MEEHLKCVYGFNNFREHQKDIINDIHDNNNVFAILPTGGGKSLLYQFPATYRNKITIVVSPLISLMNDQCDFLKTKNIKSATLNSESRINYDDLKNMTLIYTTPEFITNNIDLLITLQNNIGLFAIDEAHCVSQWSHDFRLSYQELKIIKNTFPTIPLLAVTATATPRVLEEMYEILNVSDAIEYSLGTRRDNLVIKVLPKTEFMKCKFDEPTIIYTQTRKLTETLCQELCNAGIKCSNYHAGMTIKEKNKSHEQFLKSEILVIVATISFGMGIDKSDIRHVINYGIPTDIETYYQEIGRAGRDGVLSKATIYYQDSDFATANFLISKSTDPNQIKIKKKSLNIFRRYLNEKIICRQQIIDYYFEKGDFPTANDVKHIPKCNLCDNCCGEKVSNMISVDIKNESLFIVNYIKNFYYKNNYYIGEEKLSKAVMKECGFLNINSVKYCREIIQLLITKNILSQNSIGNGRYVIGIGTEKISTNDTILIEVENKPTLKSKHKLSFSDLSLIRSKIASNNNTNPTILINDKVLYNILDKPPKNLHDLWLIDGISQDFIMRYGNELIENLKSKISIPKKHNKIYAVACDQKSSIYETWKECEQQVKGYSGARYKAFENIEQAKTWLQHENPNASIELYKNISDTKIETYNLYKQGKTINEICIERGLKNTTVESHILDVWENDEETEIDLDYADLCENKKEKILKAIKIVGTNRLRDIKNIVDDEITYFQIKLTILLEKLDLLT